MAAKKKPRATRPRKARTTPPPQPANTQALSSVDELRAAALAAGFELVPREEHERLVTLDVSRGTLDRAFVDVARRLALSDHPFLSDLSTIVRAAALLYLQGVYADEATSAKTRALVRSSSGAKQILVEAANVIETIRPDLPHGRFDDRKELLSLDAFPTAGTEAVAAFEELLRFLESKLRTAARQEKAGTFGAVAGEIDGALRASKRFAPLRRFFKRPPDRKALRAQSTLLARHVHTACTHAWESTRERKPPPDLLTKLATGLRKTLLLAVFKVGKLHARWLADELRAVERRGQSSDSSRP